MKVKSVIVMSLIIFLVFSIGSLAQSKNPSGAFPPIERDGLSQLKNMFSTYQIQHKTLFLLLAEKYTPAQQIEWEILFQQRETLLKEYKESEKGKKELAEIKDSLEEIKSLRRQAMNKEVARPKYLHKLKEYKDIFRDKMLIKGIDREEVQIYRERMGAANRELNRALKKENKSDIAEILTGMLELEQERNEWLKEVLLDS